MHQITQLLLSVVDTPDNFTDDLYAMSSLERLCVTMYSKYYSSSTLKDACLQLFCSGTKTTGDSSSY